MLTYEKFERSRLALQGIREALVDVMLLLLGDSQDDGLAVLHPGTGLQITVRKRLFHTPIVAPTQCHDPLEECYCVPIWNIRQFT